jgi:hypothetical protein
MCHKRQKSPTAETVGDSMLDIEIYPNVTPFVDSALAAQAVHERLRILKRNHQRGEFPVIA